MFCRLPKGIALMFTFWYLLAMIENIPTHELAEFLGVTPGFVSNIKAGRKRLPPEYMSRVSERFSISLDDLAKHYQKHKAVKPK
jgi:hypothetical protein